jgi:hypothetical protein
MDRKEQIEFESFSCKIIDKKLIRYRLTLIVDGEPIQCNIQQDINEDDEFSVNKEKYKKIIKGIIEQRYR